MTRACHALRVCALLLLLAACGGEEEGAQAPRGVVEAPVLERGEEGEVVARVNGRPISRARLDEALQRAGDDASPPAVLRDLIDVELLAQEAQSRGLDQRPEQRRRMRQALVQGVLEAEVEQLVSREALEPEFVREVYDRFALDVFEPELVTVSHLLIMIPQPEQTPERLAQANALAGQLRKLLEAEGQPQQMDQALDRVAAIGNLSGFDVLAEHGHVFPRHPVRPLSGQPRFIQVVEPFAEAAFALSEEAPLSDAVLTGFGVHVLVLLSKRAAVRPPFEDVREVIADALVQMQRERTATELVQGLFSEADIRVNDAPLEALAESLFSSSAPPATGP